MSQNTDLKKKERKRESLMQSDQYALLMSLASISEIRLGM